MIFTEIEHEINTNYSKYNKSATPSDIIKFISFQPDFLEDSAPEDVGTLVG